MNGTPRGAGPGRKGSSFPPGPRRGTDPEGGEKSAWKGLVGPSGLNLDHSRIPHIQQQVYGTLAPLVVAAERPIPLSNFTQKCCDVLLPVLERSASLGPHEFKSQWGRLNEFVCPELARRAGLSGGSGYSREHKTVCIDLRVPSSGAPPSSQAASPAPAPQAASTPPPASGPRYVTVTVPAQGPGPRAVSEGPAPSAPSGSPPLALPHTPSPGGGLPVPVPLPAAGVPVQVVAPPPALCSYCQGPHCMKHCQDFHRMLSSIYQAGYQAGYGAAQQAYGAAPQSTPQPAPPPQQH